MGAASTSTKSVQGYHLVGPSARQMGYCRHGALITGRSYRILTTGRAPSTAVKLLLKRSSIAKTASSTRYLRQLLIVIQISCSVMVILRLPHELKHRVTRLNQICRAIEQVSVPSNVLSSLLVSSSYQHDLFVRLRVGLEFQIPEQMFPKTTAYRVRLRTQANVTSAFLFKFI